MAIDTRDKRASALARRLGFLVIGPTPDGAFSAADRAHLAGLYRGIAITAEVIPDFVPPPIGAVTHPGRPTGAVTYTGRPTATVET